MQILQAIISRTSPPSDGPNDSLRSIRKGRGRAACQALRLSPLVPALLLLCFAGASCRQAPVQDQATSEATFVGSKACADCHEKIYAAWSDSLHNKMLRKATPEIIHGNFNNASLEHEGWHFQMFRKDGGYYIQERQPNGMETLYKVQYTLGSKRIQHFISIRPDGRMRVTFPTWDLAKGEWIHGSEIVRNLQHTPSGEHEAEPIQVWNEHCWNCHASQINENFDLSTNSFKTTFTETGINCEMCHGPGSVHVDRMNADKYRSYIPAFLRGKRDQNIAISNTGKLPPHQQMMDCAQCHTRRIMVQRNYSPSENFYDHYMLKYIELPDPKPGPPIWAERHRRFGNEVLNLWESACYRKGEVTCMNCHDPHQVTISKDERFQDTNAQCTQCHREYRDEAAVTSHTKHSLKGEGSKCINCHMILITNRIIKLLQNAEIRDHNISAIPIPENTIRYAVPNGCNNVCHTEKDNAWVIEWMDRWYPNRPRKVDFVDTIELARKKDPASIRDLIAILDRPSQPAMERAMAARVLGEFDPPKVSAALTRALADPDTMVRAEAARSLSEAQDPDAIGPLFDALKDSAEIVRLNAFFALIKMGILTGEGRDETAYARAKAEYRKFLTSFPTVFDIRINLGTFYAIQKDYTPALQEYQNARKLKPFEPLPNYYLGVTYAVMGMYDLAEASFKNTLELDPHFRNTRQLLEEIYRLKERK